MTLRLIACIAFVLSPLVDAEDRQKSASSWYTLTAENDAFGVIEHSDNGYSNGIAFSWGYGKFDSFSDIEMPNWIRFISQWTHLNKGSANRYAVSYGIGQGMYTPADLESKALIEDDRPYAGTLLWKTAINSIDQQHANNLGLTLGVAGPASLAEQTQIKVHEFIGVTIPQGWDNQIENEPVFRVEAEHVRRLFDVNVSGAVDIDTVLIGEAGLGNLRSDMGAGLGLRLGNYLAQNFAFYHPLAGRAVNTFAAAQREDFNWQISASIHASVVFNDITIDGNTFKHSHSQDLIHKQAFVSLSAACSWYNWGVIFSTQRGSDQFEGQPDISNFGSLSITYNNL
ncbi:MAG: lipid A deacylase LpxR family protein [Pseudomonadales bacterium]|nr:lipid A deacylase LpxR family protein [Pseudomonadales bacterium]